MINNTRSKVIYVVSDRIPIQSGYMITFPYFDESNIKVIITDGKTEVTVDPSNYTVVTVGTVPYLRFVSGYTFPEEVTKIVISREMEIFQETDLANGEIIDAEQLERVFDIIVAICQQLDEKLSRTLMTTSAESSPIIIPESDQRAGHLLGFDDSGKITLALTIDIQQKLNEAYLNIQEYVENTSHPELDAYVSNTSKPSLDTYVENTSKPAINAYVSNTSKPSLDTYVENTSKPAINAHVATKKTELDSYVTDVKKPELDAYGLEKENEIQAKVDSFTDYSDTQNRLNELKSNLVNVENTVFIELSGEEVNGYDFYPPSTFYETSACAIKRYEIIDGETYYLDSKRDYALGNNKSIPSLYEEFVYAKDSTGYFTNTRGYKYLFVRSKKNSVSLEVKVFTNALKELDSKIDSFDDKINAVGVYTNIANPINKINNYVWLDVNSKYGSNGWACITVKVEETKVYTCDLINEAFSWFVDKDGNSLGKITTNKFTTPVGCVEIRISKTNTNNFVVLNTDMIGDLTYSKYPYGNYFSKVSDTAQSIVSNSYVSVSMFENIGIVGDSFASGGIYGKDGVPDGAYYGLSWCSVLGRKNGVNINNYSAPGLSTKTWLINKLSEALSDSGINLYLMCLGINDSTTITTGTIGDIKEDYTQNPDTFYGNYGKIFEQLKAHSPNAKFIFIVPPESTSGEVASAIQIIAEHYGVPSFRSADDEYFHSDFFFSNHSNGHPIAISYSGMANAYERLICKCIIENKDYFANYHT